MGLEKLYKFTFAKDTVTIHECLVTDIVKSTVWYICPMTNSSKKKTYTVALDAIDTSVISDTGCKVVVMSEDDVDKARSIVKKYYDDQLTRYKKELKEKMKCLRRSNKVQYVEIKK